MASSTKASNGGYLHLRVSQEIKSAVEELARKDRRSISDDLRLIVEDHLMAQGHPSREVPDEEGK